MLSVKTFLTVLVVARLVDWTLLAAGAAIRHAIRHAIITPFFVLRAVAFTRLIFVHDPSPLLELVDVMIFLGYVDDLYDITQLFVLVRPLGMSLAL